MPALSVLVCTYRRPDRLRLLLDDLARQTRPPDEIVVVDNHDAGSAREVVEGFAARSGMNLRYDVQPRQNISLTRNRTVERATGEWLAFVDDDERVPPDWLQLLMQTAQRHDADGVLGPALCVPPPGAPDWVRRGNLYAIHHAPTGSVVRRDKMWINNALLRADRVRALPGPFAEEFGLTGGEDVDMLARLAQGGARILWCDEAQVTEPVEPARLRAGWILRRALRGGQTYAVLWRLGRFGPVSAAGRVLFVLRALAQMLAAAALAILLLPLGRHRAMHWLCKCAANAGKLSTLTGWRYREYAAPASPR